MTGYYVKVGEAIAFLILGVGFSGLNAVGYAVNHLDIAPRYAGILMGVSNSFASIPGFLSPMVTGHIAKNKVCGEHQVSITFRKDKILPHKMIEFSISLTYVMQLKTKMSFLFR